MPAEYMLEKKKAYIFVGVILVALATWILLMLINGQPVLPPKRGNTTVAINVSVTGILYIMAYFFLQPFLERALFGKLIDLIEDRRKRKEQKRSEEQQAKADLWYKLRMQKEGPVEKEEIGKGRKTKTVSRKRWNP